MTPLFADTSFYIALVSPRDMWHEKALEASNACRVDIITTEYVLLELGNYLSALSRRGFLNITEALQRDSRTQILPSSPELFKRGLNLYGQRLDKTWSLTDCISFAVMKQHGLTDALTGDRHFEQAGYNALLTR